MTTAILVGLIVVLLAAAAYVGVLLVRRSRSAPAQAEPDDVSGPPRTVADLIKRRAEPARDSVGELSGDELFVPAVPRQDGVAVPAAPDGPVMAPGAAAASSPQLVTPAGGVEVGDAPWRRAARMRGAEPGGTWATAPIPVVVPAANREAAAEVPSNDADDADDADSDDDRAAAESVSPSVVIVSRAADPAPAPPSAEPAVPASADFDPLPTPRTDHSEPVAPTDDLVEEEPADAETAAAGPAPEPVSRPLGDPDLTPLMGIPIVRPATAETPAAGTASVEPPDDTVVVPDDDAVAVAVPRTTATPVQDDDVVFLLPSTSSFPVVAPATSGSPQPVWFRVVRRDGEPVPAAVVALLDDRGREVDTTKTATDGGGELCTPHGGRFLMIVSSDGYQPRAALLTVDEEPVELALLLPRSAVVSGSVRAAGEVVRDARVVVRQDHDVVDEALTAGDGHYRFDDLAEGAYTVAATGEPGAAVARVSLGEGADVHVDLDLR